MCVCVCVEWRVGVQGVCVCVCVSRVKGGSMRGYVETVVATVLRETNK